MAGVRLLYGTPNVHGPGNNGNKFKAELQITVDARSNAPAALGSNIKLDENLQVSFEPKH